jgi:hypothetical protein
VIGRDFNMKPQERLTLQALKRKLEIQKPITFDGLCQLSSALALVSLAINLEEISRSVASMSSDLDLIEGYLQERGI